MQLYLGLDSSRYPQALHYPVIRTELILTDRFREACLLFPQFTCSIFTSKTAVRYWFENFGLRTRITIAIGRSTAHELQLRGIQPLVSQVETQEGVIALLDEMDLSGAYVFYPRSKRARSVLSEALETRQIRFFVLDLYDTIFQKLEPVPSLAEIDEIIFTSPSTVEGFLRIFHEIPRDKKLTCIGPITKEALHAKMGKHYLKECVSRPCSASAPLGEFRRL